MDSSFSAQATISLMPTHKKQDVQLLQTVPAAKAAFLSKDGPDPAMGEKGIGKGLPSQGYTGGSVMHEDGQTMTKDWMHEYDKTYVFSNSELERISF